MLCLSLISGVDMVGLQIFFLFQDEFYDYLFGLMFILVNGSNFYDVVRMGVGLSIIENLQFQLKLREGEIIYLQLEIGNLEKI